jgi:hypothetical protein
MHTGYGGKARRKETTRRPRRRCEDNIKTDLTEIGWDGLDSSDSEYRPAAGFCEFGNELSGSIKCWETAELLEDLRLLKKDSAPRREGASKTSIKRQGLGTGEIKLLGNVSMQRVEE